MKKCKSRNGEINWDGEMGKGGGREMEKWEVGKWRWRNGNQDEKEMKTSAQEKKLYEYRPDNGGPVKFHKQN